MKRTPAGTPTGGQYAPDLRKTKPPIIMNPKLPTGGAGTTQTKPATPTRAGGDGDPCHDCGESTAPGSGHFVNRVGWDDGWKCAGCMVRDCDRCDDPIPLDEDYYAPNGDNVHHDCLTMGEWRELEILEGTADTPVTGPTNIPEPDRGETYYEFKPEIGVNKIFLAATRELINQRNTTSRNAKVVELHELASHHAGAKPTMTTAEAANVATALHDIRIRDTFFHDLVTISPRTSAHARMLTRVAQMTPDEYAAPTAALLAATLYMQGDSKGAKVAASRATAADPGHALSGMVSTIIDREIPVSVWREWTLAVSRDHCLTGSANGEPPSNIEASQ